MFTNVAKAIHDAFAAREGLQDQFRPREVAGYSQGLSAAEVQGELARVARAVKALPKNQRDLVLALVAPLDTHPAEVKRVRQRIWQLCDAFNPKIRPKEQQAMKAMILTTALLSRLTRTAHNDMEPVDSDLPDCKIASMMRIGESSYRETWKPLADQIVNEVLAPELAAALTTVGEKINQINRDLKNAS